MSALRHLSPLFQTTFRATALAAVAWAGFAGLRPQAFAGFNPLEGALGFTVFTEKDVLIGGHVHGGTAIGDDLFVTSSNAEFGHDKPGTYKVSSSDGSYTSLAVNGSFVTSGSIQIGSATYSYSSGQATINSGWLSLQNHSGLNLFDSGHRLSNNWSSTVATQFQLNPTTNYNSAPSLTSNSPQPINSISRGTGIDFAAQFSKLSAASSYIATALTDNYSALNWESLGSDSKKLWITLKADSLNVVNLSASQLFSISELHLQGAKLSSTTGLIFDISGTNVTFGKVSDIGESNASYVLFNFAEATQITMGNNEIDGSILAPGATFYHPNNSANIAGQVIVENYVQPGTSEIHYSTLMIQVPEPATYAAMLGALSLGVVVWKRQTALAKRRS